MPGTMRVMSQESVPQDGKETPAGDRREFLKSAACVALGGACALVPVAAGVTVLLGPLARPAADGSWVQLTKLDGLTIGAAPRLFQVFIERTDAWTRHARNAVGSVFLERLDAKTVRAFQAACPHLGCSVEWRGEQKHFFCPCHNSAFAHDGAIIPPSPSARGLDTLEVAIHDDGEVWVKFQDFKAGVKEKLPVA
jgi:menaquinol-cytochrome c reductase iron-sulfur subunit